MSEHRLLASERRCNIKLRRYRRSELARGQDKPEWSLSLLCCINTMVDVLASPTRLDVVRDALAAASQSRPPSHPHSTIPAMYLSDLIRPRPMHDPAMHCIIVLRSAFSIHELLWDHPFPLLTPAFVMVRFIVLRLTHCN